MRGKHPHPKLETASAKTLPTLSEGDNIVFNTDIIQVIHG
jgi:hypothetical protein